MVLHKRLSKILETEASQIKKRTFEDNKDSSEKELGTVTTQDNNSPEDTEESKRGRKYLKRSTSLCLSYNNIPRCSSPFKFESGSFSSNSKIFGDVREPPSLEHISYGVFECQGKRDRMEDLYEVIPFSAPHSPSDTPFALFAVYDGHGGIQAAQYARTVLHESVVNNPCFKEDPERAIREGFRKTEEDFSNKVIMEKMDGLVGTTICMAIICNPNLLFLANLGDSAAILYNLYNDQIVPLTRPHNLSNPQERERIEKLGGVIVNNNRLGHPVWNSKLINIAVTRALGDVYFKHSQFVEDKSSGLIAEPEISQVMLTNDSCFLLIASDGFWDVVNPREAVDYVNEHSHKEPSLICKELTDLALRRPTTDNITVLLVLFKPSWND